MDENSVSGFIKEDFEGLEREFTNVIVERQTSWNVLARARRFGRWWLLKGLLPHLREDARYREMLHKELELLMRAQHPSIVQAVSLEEVEGLGECIVMEYVDGWTLKEWLATNPPMPDRRKVTEELVNVTSYLHRLNIVHRDLKPSNIMVTRNGMNVKLIDFGLADSDAYAVLKQPAGTPRYMAPEQAKGNEPDVRNDIYSLGVILDDMHLGADMEGVVRRCQEPIERRYHTADELLSELNKVFQQQMKEKEWRKKAIITTIALLVLGIGTYLWWRKNPNNQFSDGTVDMTYLIRNSHCDADSLDAWTFRLGGRTLATDGTLMYHMKNFDVYQVIHGLPAGEYELMVRAWGEDNESDFQFSKAEIYAGPFSRRVKNRVFATGSYENVLRFVLLDDSVRIGFRSDNNRRRYCRAVADEFRLVLIRRFDEEEDLTRIRTALDSAQRVEDSLMLEQSSPRMGVCRGEREEKLRNKPKNGVICNLWRGKEEPLPEGWITEQPADRCRMVHKEDVGRLIGDSDIYLEYASEEPARTGLLIGQRVWLEPGAYYFGAIFFAQNKQRETARVHFGVKGLSEPIPAETLMNWYCNRLEVKEAQEVTVGLWAEENSDVYRAGICELALYHVLDK